MYITKESKTHINNNELWPSLTLGMMAFCTTIQTGVYRGIFTFVIFSHLTQALTKTLHFYTRYIFFLVFFFWQWHIIECWSWIGQVILFRPKIEYGSKTYLKMSAIIHVYNNFLLFVSLHCCFIIFFFVFSPS